MNRPTARSNALRIAAAGFVLAAVAGVVLLALWLEPRLAIAAGCTAIAALVAGYLWRLSNPASQQMQHDLSRLNVTFDMRSDGLRQLQPSYQNAAWKQPFTQVCERLFQLRNRIEDDAHSRASVEVRLKRLRNEQRRLLGVIDSLSDAVIAIDHFDEVVLTNPAAVQLLKIDAAADSGQKVATAITSPELRSAITETRKHKHLSSRTCEFEFETAEGPCCFLATCHAVEVATESSTSSRGVVVVLKDVSAQKAIQKRNAEFVSAVSHEMKTPLSGIKAYVELLADGEDEDQETRDEFLDVINGQADRLQRLIDNLLNLARIEAGVVAVDKQQRSLNEVLEEAISVVSPSADSKGIQLRVELSPMYLAALADRDMLLQSAINLLSNAIKYTASGGAVTLRSRMTDEHVLFEVEDSGVGLNEEDCARVFEKFYRVKKDQQMAAGTGLGLPLAKHIVEDVHGGHLSVESQPGVGSTFRVELPPANELSA